MKVTFYAVCTVLSIAASLASAADPECTYRQRRNLTAHWHNPNDCSRFFRCSTRGIRREIFCTDGKVYNSLTGKCVKNRRGICKLSLAEPMAADDNVCADAVDGAYLPEAGYCRNFYICQDKVAYPQACPAGSYFDSTASHCEPDTENSCWQNSCLQQPDGQYLANQASCTSFYICQNEIPIQQTCSTGSYFNVTTSNCLPDENGEHCWENVCLDKANGVNVADSTSCNSYYVCEEQKPTLETCAAGSYFDKKLLICEVGDCPDETTTITTPTDGTTTTPSGGLTTTTPEVGSTTTQSPNDICLDKKNGEYVADCNSCDGYYLCNDQQATLLTCPAGSYFNREVLICQQGECPYFATTTPPDTTTEVCTTTTPAECNSTNVCLNKEDGVLVADSEDCHNFYVCKYQQATLNTCPAGSYFNEELLACQQGECPCTGDTTTQEPVTATVPPLTTTVLPEECETTTWVPTTTTTCAPVITTTTTCEPVITTTTCAPVITTTTCEPEITTTTTCAPVITTTTREPVTTTTCSPVITTTTCEPVITTTTTCAPVITTTTTCEPVITTTTTCAPVITTTTTCEPVISTTTPVCETTSPEPDITTTTSKPVTTTTSRPVTTTTTCAPVITTTTTCAPVITTTTTCEPVITTTTTCEPVITTTTTCEPVLTTTTCAPVIITTTPACETTTPACDQTTITTATPPTAPC